MNDITLYNSYSESSEIRVKPNFWFIVRWKSQNHWILINKLIFYHWYFCSIFWKLLKKHHLYMQKNQFIIVCYYFWQHSDAIIGIQITLYTMWHQHTINRLASTNIWITFYTVSIKLIIHTLVNLSTMWI